jgi:hypothetical protein
VSDIKYPDLVDRYAELKYPQKYGEVQSEIVARLDAMAVIEPFAEREENLYLARKKYYSQFIAENAPFNADDVLKGIKAHSKSAKAGSKLKKNDHVQEIVLRAFLQVDLSGGTTADAIKQAWDAITIVYDKSPVNEKTIPEWLKAILFLTDIKPSPRGRPKNKSG